MNKLYFIIKSLVFLFIFFIIVNISLYVYAYITPKIMLKTSTNIEIYDNKDNLVLGNTNGQKWASLDSISPKVIESTISIEDKNFYNHKGFDFLRIGKAFINNAITGSLSQGASTISQQYVKNMFLDFDKKWKRKIEEAKLTLELEVHYTKDEILEGYLNTINYSNGNYGIENASLFYFNKPSKDLSWAEATFLIGIPKNPTYYNPITNFDNAKDRQKDVLYSLVKNKKITIEQSKNIYNQEIIIYGQNATENPNSVLYFKDAVLSELQTISKVNTSLINAGGLKIYTTLDTDKQKEIENIINNEISSDDDIQIASLLINPKTGAVESLIGGKNYNFSQFNRATNAKRQVGSTMKTFLYYTALENGFTSSSSFRSEPTTFNLGNNKTYTPINYGKNYANKDITLSLALALSDNIFAVKTHLFLGEERLVETIKRSGIKSKMPVVASLPLGTHELTMYDYARGYTTLASLGKKNDLFMIRKVVDSNNNIIYEHKQKEEYVLDNRYVYILNELMSNTYNYNFIDYTTPTMLGIKNILTNKYAIKSGSTSTDYWTIGYNKDALLLVWNGYDDNKEVNIKHSSINKTIWAKSIESSLKNNKTSWYDIQNNVVATLVNPVNGKIDNSNNTSILYYIKGTEPSLSDQILKDMIDN